MSINIERPVRAKRTWVNAKEDRQSPTIRVATANEPSLVLQFGTSRFLQAHVDLFISESFRRGLSQTKVAVVQSSERPAGKARVRAMNECAHIPVRIRGLLNGEIIDETEYVSSIVSALLADEDWEAITELFCKDVGYVVSNTGDTGYVLNKEDIATSKVPRSFPAKLLSLLRARYDQGGSAVTILPCELVSQNGDVLKELVTSLAIDWSLSQSFIVWLREQCIWANTLVDRIVSEPIEPIGAVAEPYALWAIEDQPGLVLPCEHDAIKVVQNLRAVEWLKLGVLNLGHTYLVDQWLAQEAGTITTVGEAMQDDGLRGELEAVLDEEVVPILRAMNLGEDIDAYVSSVIERFMNPFLHHRLSDIADHHDQKIERRVRPIYNKGRELSVAQSFPRLQACLQRDNSL